MIMEEIHDCTVKGGEDMARHGTLKKEQIVGLRRELGLSMRAFADVIGINASTVSRYETDGMGPSRDVESKIKALAGGWDIDLDSFLV